MIYSNTKSASAVMATAAGILLSGCADKNMEHNVRPKINFHLTVFFSKITSALTFLQNHSEYNCELNLFIDSSWLLYFISTLSKILGRYESSQLVSVHHHFKLLTRQRGRQPWWGISRNPVHVELYVLGPHRQWSLRMVRVSNDWQPKLRWRKIWRTKFSGT